VQVEIFVDFYYKKIGFFRGMENKRQKTDVHYRSLNGEGMFNWRLKFPFQYLPTEDKIVVQKKKSFLALTAEEMKLPPIFALQVRPVEVFFCFCFYYDSRMLFHRSGITIFSAPMTFWATRICASTTWSRRTKRPARASSNGRSRLVYMCVFVCWAFFVTSRRLLMHANNA
jgi:hypothetical protein